MQKKEDLEEINRLNLLELQKKDLQISELKCDVLYLRKEIEKLQNQSENTRRKDA